MDIAGITRYFVFTILPFKLTSAPFIFTKTLACLVKFWRMNRIKISCFFDDDFEVSNSYTSAINASILVRNA